jgi:Pyruvate/2-oxoacid:ferredoxin oxidoreductase delta subunit
MSCKQLLVYYTSGTGNSYRVARWLAARSEEGGWLPRVVSIEQARPSEEVWADGAQVLLLVAPTHGFTTPWHMLRFAIRLPAGRSTPAYCVATRAGVRFGKWFPPGMAGSCALLLALVLTLKGYRVRGTMSVDMPSNWYSLHPIQGTRSIDLIRARGMKKTRAFAAKVLECRRVWLTPNNVYELIFGLLLAPISLAYLVVGRFFLAKLFFANNRCDGCGLCAKGCPVRAINMWGHEQPRPFWSHRCESCMRCAAFCPHNAIEAGHSWGVALYFLSTAPVAYYLFLWLGALAPALRGLNETWVGTTASLLYWYPAIFLPYYGLHLLLRIPAVNWLFTHTTLTHYWGRYREPEVKLGQLMGTKVDRANAIHRPQEPEGRVQAKPKTDCSMWP